MFIVRFIVASMRTALKSLLFLPLSLMAAQLPDPAYVPNVPAPEYAPAPIVLFDHGHNNFHRVDQRYNGFRDLLTADGYNVRAIDGQFAAVDVSTGLPAQTVFDNEKGKARMLVIANACGIVYQTYPCDTTNPALTDLEVSKIITWVRGGGSLLLIFDHTPFNQVTNLTSALGIDIVGSGYATYNGIGKIDFPRNAGLNQNSVIANGRSANEVINQVRVFTGSAFRLSATPAQNAIYQPLLTLPSGAISSGGESVAGAYMGMAMRLGAGRVYVSSEAGMFSAQVQTDSTGRVASYMGINDPGAAYNAQYLLNIVHWLEGKLFDGQLEKNGPDLVVASVTGSIIASTNTLSLAYTVCNLGNANSNNSVDMAIYLSQDEIITNSDTFIRYVSVPPLGPRQCVSRADTAASGTPGTYYLGAILDYTKRVIETYEGNNIFTGATISLPVLTLPDLVAKTVSGPTTGRAGGSVVVSYSVCNQGVFPGNYFGTGIYLSSDSNITSSDYSLGVAGPDSLAAGACLPGNNVTMTIPTNTPPGTYYLGMITDIYGAVEELKKNNNVLTGNKITISP